MLLVVRDVSGASRLIETPYACYCFDKADGSHEQEVHER